MKLYKELNPCMGFAMIDIDSHETDQMSRKARITRTPAFICFEGFPGLVDMLHGDMLLDRFTLQSDEWS
jgi:hypothetical protein